MTLAPIGVVEFATDPAVPPLVDPHHRTAHWTRLFHGGHFPAMEQPDPLVGDIRAFFASLC